MAHHYKPLLDFSAHRPSLEHPAKGEQINFEVGLSHIGDFSYGGLCQTWGGRLLKELVLRQTLACLVSLFVSFLNITGV